MAKRVIPYPRICSNAAIKRLGVDVSWALSSEDRELSHEFLNECQCRITDKVWYPDSSPLKIVANGRMRNAIRLFDGVEGNAGCAVANRLSMIGIAFRWRLPKCNLQGAVPCKDVSFSQSGEVAFGASLEFPPLSIRFQLEIEVVLYLKDSGGKSRDVYASSRGALLGPLAKFVLLTGGSGGYFPTEVISDEKAPLWRIHANLDEYEDFKEDFTSSVFCLILNDRHPLYEQVYVSSKDGKVCLSPLMFEIFVNCCYVLIMRACKLLQDESWELRVEEKDDVSVLVNFKSLKRRCLGGFSRKEISEMEPEALMLELRKGLADCVAVDCGEVKE